MKIWRVSGDSDDRPFADEFKTHGVGLLVEPDGWGQSYQKRFQRCLRVFRDEVKAGDVFAATSKRNIVRCIGVVDGDYRELPQFDDLYGWNMRHARRVRWNLHLQEHQVGEPGRETLPSIDEIGRDSAMGRYVLDCLNSEPTGWKTSPLPELPAVEECIDELPDAFLTLREAWALVNDLVRAYSDRDNFPDYPCEAEVESHFVVPVLRGLGWRPEQIAVEIRRMDVVVFSKLPRTPRNCRFIIEIKRLGTGPAHWGLKQVRAYRRDFCPSCDAVVTDGVRYWLYGEEPEAKLLLYANLLRLRKSSLSLLQRLCPE
jgi:hypothetical protein